MLGDCWLKRKGDESGQIHTVHLWINDRDGIFSQNCWSSAQRPLQSQCCHRPLKRDPSTAVSQQRARPQPQPNATSTRGINGNTWIPPLVQAGAPPGLWGSGAAQPSKTFPNPSVKTHIQCCPLMAAKFRWKEEKAALKGLLAGLFIEVTWCCLQRERYGGGMEGENRGKERGEGRERKRKVCVSVNVCIGVCVLSITLPKQA